MSKDIVMLSLYLDKVKDKDIHYPLLMSEKLDGVMADLYKDAEGYHLRTRQGKELPSMQWYVDKFKEMDYLEEGEHFIGELYCDYGLARVPNFNKISGRLRQLEEQATEITFNLFDYYEEGWEDKIYYRTRFAHCEQAADNQPQLFKLVPIIDQVDNREEMLAQYDYYMKAHPNAEGVVCRPINGVISLYKVGRSKGFLKIVPKPTVDLTIEQIVEAKGEQVGQAGKVICHYNGKEIAVGMGSIVHDVRKDMWQHPDNYIGRTVEIKYKDITEDGVLRMPVVLRFREDKDD